jgi:hypothetical protein
MTALVWDQVEERTYQTGVDHGVLYLPDDSAVVWNGISSVEESPNSELKPYYLDGIKYLESLIPGDFVGKLKAFTYPDEFDLLNGIAEVSPGLMYHDQPGKSFSLAYRTRIGNSSQGTDHGYRLHVLYHVLAISDSYLFPSLGEEVQPTEFSWTLSSTPVLINGRRPTAHISIDSTKTSSTVLQTLEDALYGTDSVDPGLLSIDEILAIFGP